MNRIIIVADNIRSIENTGAIFRIADGVNAKSVVLVGITPYPDLGESDPRRPWLKHKVTARLKKTGLDGMATNFEYFADQEEAIKYLQEHDCILVAVEQTTESIVLNKLRNRLLELMSSGIGKNIAIILGHETDGVSKAYLEASQVHVEIPMHGKGKSLNVAVAAGIVAYTVREFLDSQMFA